MPRRKGMLRDMLPEHETAGWARHQKSQQKCSCGSRATHSHMGYGCCGGEMCCPEANM